MLYTIGYEGLKAEHFVQELKRRGINVLVDVREMPLSRKKGFSKTALSALLEAEGIQYRHLKALGAPREVRYRLKATGDWAEYCTGYLAHLSSCSEVLSELAGMSSDSVCLMCFEANYRECHRSLITERLTALGHVAEVVHLSPQLQTTTASVERLGERAVA